MTKKTKPTKPTTIPIANTQWAEHFRSHVMKQSFNLSLSQTMIEFLCAVADNVRWDRGNVCDIHRPDNWYVAEACLIKRGLVRCKRDDPGQQEKWAEQMRKEGDHLLESCVELTPAGKAVVELFKVTGIFVEADNAILKKARKA